MKIFKLAAAVALSALLSTAAVAGEDSSLYLTATVTSYHVNRDVDRNEDNPGIGVEYASGTVRGSLAKYKNSFDKDSVLVAGAWLPVRVAGVNAGIVAGAVTGYPQNEGKVGPFGAAMFEYVHKNSGIGLNVLVVPPAKTKNIETSGVVTFQLKWSLL